MGLADLLDKRTLWIGDIATNLLDAVFRRLTEEQRAVLRALSVYRMAVPVEALAFLTGSSSQQICQSLRPLLVQGVIQPTENRRYQVHAVVAMYVQTHFVEGDEQANQQALRAAHAMAADYYAQRHKSREKWQTISDLEPQLLEFEHRVGAEDYNRAVKLIDEIDTRYLSLWGHARRVLSMREQLLGKIIDKGLEEKNLGYLGLANHTLGQFKQAIDYYQQALRIAREISDREISDRDSEEIWFGNLGRSYRNLGCYEPAIKNLKQAIKIAQEVGNSQNEAEHLDNLGLTYFDLGQVEQAVEYSQRAINIMYKNSEQRFLVRYLGNLGNAYHVLEQAVELYNQSLEIARGNKDQRNEAIWLGNLANAYVNLGLLEEAVKLYQQALKIVSKIGDRRLKGILLRDLGSDYIKQLKYEPSIKCLQKARRIASEIGDPRLQSYAGGYLAQAWLHIKHLSDASETITATQQYSSPTNDHHVRVLHGLILLRLREQEKAQNRFQDALDCANDLLTKTSDYFVAKYTRGLALSGLALLARGDERASLLAQAQDAYLVAVDSCNGKGVVMDALHLLNELQLLGEERVLVPLKKILNWKG